MTTTARETAAAASQARDAKFIDLIAKKNRQSAAKLAQLRTEVAADIVKYGYRYFAEYQLAQVLEAEYVADIYAQAAQTFADLTAAAAREQLADELGRTIRSLGRSTDLFVNATNATRRETALRVLRDVQDHLNTNQLVRALAG